MKIFLLIVFVCSIATSLFAQIDNAEKLEKIDESLHKVRLPLKERTELLFEKSKRLLDEDKIQEATVALIEAVRLDPDNEKYFNHLVKLYKRYWKLEDYSGNDKESKTLRKTQKEIERMIKLRKRWQ